MSKLYEEAELYKRIYEILFCLAEDNVVSNAIEKVSRDTGVEEARLREVYDTYARIEY